MRQLLPVLAFSVTLSGCFSAMLIDDTPTMGMGALSGVPTIQAPATLVLEPALARHTTSTSSYRQWAGNRWVQAPYTLRTGQGLASSLRHYVKAAFGTVREVGSLYEALTPQQDGVVSKIIIRPRIGSLLVTDHGPNASGFVQVHFDVYTADGTPTGHSSVMGRSRNVVSTVSFRMSSSSDPGLQERYVVHTRLIGALDAAYNDLAANLGPQLVRGRAVAAALSGSGDGPLRAFAMTFSAAVACASSRGNDAGEASRELGLDDPAISRRVYARIAEFTADERLEAHVRACAPASRSFSDLLSERIVLIRQQIAAESFGDAASNLQPLAQIAPAHPELQALGAELQTTQRAAEEREAKKRADAEAAAKAEAERQAAALAKRTAQADELVADGQKALRSNKEAAARSLAEQALQLIPDHWGAKSILGALSARQAEKARRAREVYVRKLKSQVPGMIRRCQTMRGLWARASEALRRAAASGQPRLVEVMTRKKQQVSATFNSAKFAVQEAIRAYQQEGLQDAANAVSRAARDCF